MKISVVIPAHNEEAYLSTCLASIRDQRLPEAVQVETIVVLNRCTDRTADIAAAFGARTVNDTSKNLSAIKNRGVALATGDWVITVDADSWLSPGVLESVYAHAQDDTCVGGGIRIRPERQSLGIWVGYSMMLVPAYFLGLSFGLYWFRKADFDAIGGFDERRHIAEDVDFQRRLKRHARRTGRRQSILKQETLTTSCRKFDAFGDWHFVRIFSNPCRVRRAILGHDQTYLDRNWYEVER